MFDKKERLTKEILERIEKLRKSKQEEFSNLMPLYTMETITNSEKSLTILNKLRIIGRLLFDYDKMEEVISNLKWTLFDEKFEPYKNPYGLLFTRSEMFFDFEFFDLPLDDQVNITLVEIFNGFSEKGSMNEAFLGLCHFGFFDHKPIYSQSKRGTLVKTVASEGVKLPILFDRNAKTRVFIRNYHSQSFPYSDIKYFRITQYAGWYSSNDWKEYFEELKREA